ncbi:EAL domain-containing protein [Sphingomonas sp. KR1UV-12]|uniref:EAL domain-containing protein n=1 Tax=Sphingomonas aurea TaxID=3063994 RepID=A0ABT9EJ94_9SPHN|nr:EAL domain-containing protein [Sphingomonas sp. KR1UV-12]MDP1027011.1 EAL domain-containing protein [Sphingomonas sp. KR1UV-12]
MRLDRRPSSWITLALIVALGIAMMTSRTGDAIDRGLMPLRFAAVDRSASGTIVMVEMDAESAAAIRRWPWSRTHYAMVVDHLRKAGAASIVFDVDFSSASDAAGDQLFANALARAPGLVALPTFSQNASSSDRRSIDALPIPILRDHVALASVSIRPSEDGQVRDMPLATVTEGQPRPSLSAYIAARSGVVDQQFPIDMSIDPATIPRMSFVDVRNGLFDPALVKGRNILIGATAIEMGDRYGTPRWGVVPGVVVQALAAETLLRGTPRYGSRSAMLMLGALIAAAMLRCRSAMSSIVIGAIAGIAIVIGVLVAQYHTLIVMPLATALMMIFGAAVTCGVRDVLRRFHDQRLSDEATGLANARALLRQASGQDMVVLAAAQIGNYDALRAVLGERAIGDVVIRISERLALAGERRAVYRATDHQLVFLLGVEQAIDDTLHGLRALLLQPVEVSGRRVDVALTIGVATGVRANLERLLAGATLAADEARAGDSFWRRAEMDTDSLDRSISLMGELDEAIAAGHVQVFYQPKYDLRRHQITSVEALVRWRHPVRGFIGPDLFIPVAEKSNRIAPLTLHVLAQVLHDLSAWRIDHPHVTAAVNISAKLLSDAAFNGAVERLVASASVPTAAIVFEVTESAAMSDASAAIASLNRYRELGIAISMDDYGTGQSTLTYLRELPISELKIDRTFVQFAHSNHDDGILVRSTIELAHQLGLKVVAEGVEEEACLTFLTACGCDLIQGYFISKPLPLADLRMLLDEGMQRAA